MAHRAFLIGRRKQPNEPPRASARHKCTAITAASVLTIHASRLVARLVGSMSCASAAAFARIRNGKSHSQIPSTIDPARRDAQQRKGATQPAAARQTSLGLQQVAEHEKIDERDGGQERQQHDQADDAKRGSYAPGDGPDGVPPR